MCLTKKVYIFKNSKKEKIVLTTFHYNFSIKLMNNAKCRIFTARGVLASTWRVEKFERVLVAILAKIKHVQRKTRLLK